jgi:hypothetical protein
MPREQLYLWHYAHKLTILSCFTFTLKDIALLSFVNVAGSTMRLKKKDHLLRTLNKLVELSHFIMRLSIFALISDEEEDTLF